MIFNTEQLLKIALGKLYSIDIAKSLVFPFPEKGGDEGFYEYHSVLRTKCSDAAIKMLADKIDGSHQFTNERQEEKQK